MPAELSLYFKKKITFMTPPTPSQFLIASYWLEFCQIVTLRGKGIRETEHYSTPNKLTPLL